jgi:hypothetical protein
MKQPLVELLKSHDEAGRNFDEVVDVLTALRKELEVLLGKKIPTDMLLQTLARGMKGTRFATDVPAPPPPSQLDELAERTGMPSADVARRVMDLGLAAFEQQLKSQKKPREFTDDFFDQYAHACAWGSVLELRMRVLADNTPSMKHLAHAQKLEDIETAIANHFATELRAGEHDLLAKSRVLRNKVMHGNFSVAKAKLLELGHELGDGGVMQFQLPPGNLTAETLAAVLAGSSKRVADTPTTESDIMGWLLECGTTGVFQKAGEAFEKAILIVDRLVRLPSLPKT